MRMVAARAGISVGGLYIYFENKENLYATVVADLFENLSRKTEETVRKIPDPVEAMHAFLRMRLSYARRNRELIISNNKERRIALGADMKKRFFEGQRLLIEEVVRKGVESGDFAFCEPTETAKVIMGVIRGFVFSLVVDPDNLFSEEECSRVILNGLLHREAASQ